MNIFTTDVVVFLLCYQYWEQTESTKLKTIVIALVVISFSSHLRIAPMSRCNQISLEEEQTFLPHNFFTKKINQMALPDDAMG